MLLPILNVDSGDIPELVLVVGDPDRVRRAAGHLDRSTEIGRHREYVTLAGRHRGARVGVVSHGVGAAGPGACFEEILRAGARRVIRAGTCGGMQDDVTDRHPVIVTAAVRDEGFTPWVAPDAYPAVASPDVVGALRRAAGDRAGVHEGITLTSDVFYSHDILGSNLSLWQKAVEMECSALFVLAGLAGTEAGAVLAADGNPLAQHDEEMSGYDPHRRVVSEAVGRMIGIAFDALVDGEA